MANLEKRLIEKMIEELITITRDLHKEHIFIYKLDPLPSIVVKILDNIKFIIDRFENQKEDIFISQCKSLFEICLQNDLIISKAAFDLLLVLSKNREAYFKVSMDIRIPVNISVIIKINNINCIQNLLNEAKLNEIFSVFFDYQEEKYSKKNDLISRIEKDYEDIKKSRIT